MIVETIRSRFFELRAFLVFAALISLCVSSNVGPCFLPLPAVTDHVVEHRPNLQHDAVSSVRSPSRIGSDSFRVPMMGQTQKRADQDYDAQPIAGSPAAGIVLSDDAPVAVELSLEFLYLPSGSMSQPSGRAPPRSV